MTEKIPSSDEALALEVSQSEEDVLTSCEECGDEMDRDCQGNIRCPSCDGPCLCCYDGDGPI